MKKYCADFETATWFSDKTFVWAYAITEIKDNNDEVIIGNNIKDFLTWCENAKNPEIYFHNEKFDGEFIISYLLKNGFRWIKDKREREDKTFTTLITDTGIFYSIEIYFKVGNKKIKKCKILDSLKILNFSVEQIGKMFGLSISKLKIDYKKERSENHILTDEEREYIKNDVLIVSKALNFLFKQNLTKMTSASNALFDYKKILTQNKFNHYFPQIELEVDKLIRQSYKGGFTYLNPIYSEVEVGDHIVLDVNSLYPSVMYEKKMPFGNPVWFEGRYKKDKVYDLYIQRLTCSFKIKKNKIPTIQLKNSRFFLSNEYVESTDGEIVDLVLTNIDLDLFFEHYDVNDITYWGGFKFRSINGLFTEYIDKYIKIKNEATISGNKGMRTLAKLMLNSLYGKFALSLVCKNKKPFLGEDGVVHYENLEEEEREGLYIPVGSFITSYAREKTIRTSQAIKEYSIKNYGKDMYIYSDTDSIHTTLSIEECKKFCDIDDVKLGYWKHEATYKKGKYIRQKTYLNITFEDEIEVTCAGMPKRCIFRRDIKGFKKQKMIYYNKQSLKNKKFKRSYFFENIETGKKELFTIKKFSKGFKCGGKLRYKHVDGGVLLIDTDFTIKEDKIKKELSEIIEI